MANPYADPAKVNLGQPSTFVTGQNSVMVHSGGGVTNTYANWPRLLLGWDAGLAQSYLSQIVNSLRTGGLFSAYWSFFYNGGTETVTITNADYSYLSSYCAVCVCVRTSGGCFPPGTMIVMAGRSTKLAEEIAVGESVWNPITASPARVDAIREGAEQVPLVEFGFEEVRVDVTQNHPVLTQAGLKKAHELTTDDAVVGTDGQLHRLSIVRELPVADGQMVLNFVINLGSEAEADHFLIADGVVTGDLYLQNQLSQH